MKRRKITAREIKFAKATDKPKKISIGDGLYLLVQPNNPKKYWRMAYRFNSKQKTLALGVYPEVSLEDANESCREARKLLKAGIDPSENRKALKLSKATQNADSFEVLAREWLTKESTSWASSHTDKVAGRLERDIFPFLGSRPIASIKAPELLAAARRIEERGAIESARRTLLHCSQVFRYAVSSGRAEHDPAPNLRGALQPAMSAHYATMTDPNAIGELLRAIDSYHGSFITKYAWGL